MSLGRILSIRFALAIGFLFSSALSWSLPEGIVRIHYNRVASDYDGWGLHVWGDGLQLERKVTWGRPLMAAGSDGFGIYFDVPISSSTTKVGFIVHRGSEKNVPEDMNIDVASTREVWHLQDDPRLYGSRSAAAAALAPKQKSNAARLANDRENAKREAALKADMLALAKQAEQDAKKKSEAELKKEEEAKRKEKEEQERMAAERERLIAQLKAQRDAELAQTEQDRYKQQEQALKDEMQRRAAMYAKQQARHDREARLSPGQLFAVTVGGGFALLIVIVFTIVLWQRRKVAAQVASS